MNHFMVDLETMGLQNNAAIVSIGVVEFDENVVGRTFYVNVSLEDCIRCGLVTSESTIDWWSKQSEAARSAWTKNPDPVPLIEALGLLNRFLEKGDGGFSGARIWGNGAGFDNVLLKSAYFAVGADDPWKHYHNRCYRTMKSEFPLTEEETPARVGTYHNALDDALTQTLTLQAICSKYGIRLA